MNEFLTPSPLAGEGWGGGAVAAPSLDTPTLTLPRQGLIITHIFF